MKLNFVWMDKHMSHFPQKSILLIATEWFSKKGGLSTFNRQLCIALAKANQKVYCYLPDFTMEEEIDAKTNNVILLHPPKNSHLDNMASMFYKPLGTESINFDIIVGHDHVTGETMKKLKEDYYPEAETIFFIHTSPGEIEWYKPEQQILSVTQKAEEKERKQKEIAKVATIVAAVGPHLYFETQSLLAGIQKPIQLVQFNPGLSKEFDDISFDSTSLTPEALLMGRVEDFHLKGVDIAVTAMHSVYNQWTQMINGIIVKPKLIIRGVSVGSDVELLKKLKIYETSKLRIQPKHYNPDIEIINEDIRKSAIVLMTSRAEGFGLVGLEAISSGRPVLMSETSGLAKLLQQIAPDHAKDWIIPESVDDNVNEWARNIKLILEDREETTKKLKVLAKRYSEKISWETSVEELLMQLSGKNAKHPLGVINKSNNKTVPQTAKEHGIYEYGRNQFEIKIPKNEFFANRVAAAFPGIRGLTWMDNPLEIISRLQILLANPLKFSKFPGQIEPGNGYASPIWWFRGGSSMSITHFQPLSNTKCLIGWDELNIERIAIFRDHSESRQFIYVRTQGDIPAPTADAKEINIQDRLQHSPYVDQEFGLYKGHYIKREEFDDGAAIINGIPETFDERPELRTRFLTPYNFIITSQSSIYNSPEADNIFDNYLDRFLVEGEDAFPDLLEELSALGNYNKHVPDFKTW